MLADVDGYACASDMQVSMSRCTATRTASHMYTCCLHGLIFTSGWDVPSPDRDHDIHFTLIGIVMHHRCNEPFWIPVEGVNIAPLPLVYQVLWSL